MPGSWLATRGSSSRVQCEASGVSFPEMWPDCASRASHCLSLDAPLLLSPLSTTTPCGPVWFLDLHVGHKVPDA